MFTFKKKNLYQISNHYRHSTYQASLYPHDFVMYLVTDVVYICLRGTFPLYTGWTVFLVILVN